MGENDSPIKHPIKPFWELDICTFNFKILCPLTKCWLSERKLFPCCCCPELHYLKMRVDTALHAGCSQSILRSPYVLCRPVGAGGAGGTMAPPGIGRTLKPISTSWADHAQHITTCNPPPPKIFRPSYCPDMYYVVVFFVVMMITKLCCHCEHILNRTYARVVRNSKNTHYVNVITEKITRRKRKAGK